MSTFTLDIEKLAFGGAGFGHRDGKACFVPFTAPGDRVLARTVREKRSYLEAELVELIESSPLRTEPLCPVFGRCGGCSLQHLTYDSQLTLKEGLFAEQLHRFAQVDRSVVSPIIGAAESWNYRTRVQIKVRWIDGAPIMGFYRPGSHFVVPFPSGCAIASPVINSLLPEFRDLLNRLPEPDRIPQVDVATGDDGQAIVIFHYIGEAPDSMADFLCADSRAVPSAAGLCLQSGRKDTLRVIRGTERLTYAVPAGEGMGKELRLGFSKGGFSQVNFAQNRRLISSALDMAPLSERTRVLDLYCGNGNFSLPLALCSGEVVGIEEYLPSIEDARRNADLNAIPHTRFYAADAAREVQKIVASGERFDMVLLDPPRSGAAELVRHLPALGADSVIYVSCDPVTLARDIATLKKSGYCVVRAVPVDMFPHTYHIESVTLLERCDGTR